MRSDITKDTLLRILDSTIIEKDSFTLLTVRLGIRYCAVVIQKKQRDPNESNTDGNRYCGLAATLIHEINTSGCDCLSPIPEEVIGNSLEQSIDLLSPHISLHRSLLLASINAWCQAVQNFENSTIEPVQPLFELCKNKVVGMIGFFEPLISPIVKQAKSFRVCEFNQERNQKIEKLGLKTLESEKLNECDLIICTATALINNTFPEFVSRCHEKSIILMGPSTPLIPEFFKRKFPQVKRLAGRVVTDINATLDVISLGCGTPHFKPYTRKMELLL